MTDKFSHIKVFEIEECYGSVCIPKVVFYNENKITYEDALRYVKLAEYNDNVLVMPKKQAIALFRDGKELEE